MFYISLSEKFPLFRKKMKRFYFSFIFQPQYLFLLLSSLRVSLFLLQCLKENTYLIQLLSNLEALPYSNIHLFFPTYLISELSLHRLFLSTLNAAVIILAQWREKKYKKRPQMLFLHWEVLQIMDFLDKTLGTLFYLLTSHTGHTLKM